MKIDDNMNEQSKGGAPAPMSALPTPPLSPSPSAPALPPVLNIPPTKPRSSGKAVTYLLGLAILVAVAGIAFAGGRLTAPAASNRTGFGANGGTTFTRPGASGVPEAAGFGAGGVTLRGTVSAVSATSLTIKTTSGQSVTVDLGSATTYHQSTGASSAVITTGASVEIGVNGTGVSRGTAASAAPAITATDVTVVSP